MDIIHISCWPGIFRVNSFSPEYFMKVIHQNVANSLLFSKLVHLKLWSILHYFHLWKYLLMLVKYLGLHGNTSATFRLQYEDDYEYNFSVLSMRCRFGGQKILKCACSELKTRTRSRSRTPIWRSLFSCYYLAFCFLEFPVCLLVLLFFSFSFVQPPKPDFAKFVFPSISLCGHLISQPSNNKMWFFIFIIFIVIIILTATSLPLIISI